MVTLGEIFRRYGVQYRARFGHQMSCEQEQAMCAIEACRTEALGRHVYRCPACASTRYSYHSCRNRHCPTCQHHATQTWLAQQQALLLPVPYFLVTFTLPASLLPVARRAPRTIYTLLFRASAAALMQLAQDRRFLGGQIGMLGCRAVGSGAAALTYLAPYILRVALSNNRIVDVHHDRVTFRYRDGDTKQIQTCTLPALAFIGRFVQHVLPKGFVKVRYYGLFRIGDRRVLEQVRVWLAPLGQAEPPSAPTPASSRPSLPSAPAVLRCPACGQSMQLVQTVVRQSRAPPAWP